MHAGQVSAQVDALRKFNRFYTRHVGALDEGLLGTRFTLTQARVLYELGTRSGVSTVAFLYALEQTGGNQTRAAALLSVPLRTFQDKMKEYGLGRPRKR